MYDGKITGIDSPYGGAVYVGYGGQFIMNNGEISQNTTGESGAAIVLEGGNSL